MVPCYKCNLPKVLPSLLLLELFEYLNIGQNTGVLDYNSTLKAASPARQLEFTHM